MYYYLQAACEGEDWFNLIAIAGVRVYMGICGVSLFRRFLGRLNRVGRHFTAPAKEEL